MKKVLIFRTEKYTKCKAIVNKNLQNLQYREPRNEPKHIWKYVYDGGGTADHWSWDCSTPEKENRLIFNLI